jgi:hypothetical protein
MTKMLQTAAILAIVLLPTAVLAQAPACDPGAAGTNLCNAIPGVNLANGPMGLFGRVFTYLGIIIGTLAILMVVYSGFRMIISRGEPEALKSAKAGFAWAIGGFLVSILSFVLVLAFQNFVGVDPGSVSVGQPTIGTPLGDISPQQFIFRILRNFLGFVGILASVMLLVNVYQYMTGRGNEEQTKKAKSGMLWSVVGFLAAILAYVIISAVANLFP